MIKMYTLAEYAKKKKVSRQYIFQLVREKKLVSVQVAPKLHLIIEN